MRWQWLLIGVLVTGALSLRASQSDPQATLEARTARLQAHIEHVESVRAVKRLQYAYRHYVELGLWDDFADLFADDATTNYQQGVAAARKKSGSSSCSRSGQASSDWPKAASTRTSCFSPWSTCLRAAVPPGTMAHPRHAGRPWRFSHLV